MLREFITGFGVLGRGFGFWRTRPGVMLLGLIPAVIAFVVLVAALIVLGVYLPGLVDWTTPFADEWDGFWRDALRLAIGIIVFVAAGVLAVIAFTALALAIGEPFYERVSRAVEIELGGEEPASSGGFWNGIGDAAQLLALGILTAVCLFLIGLIPVVGSVIASVLGFFLTARLLARELIARAFDARGLSLARRRALLKTRRWRVLGFGVATQLCFLVPLGAIVTMPAAVAGATMLARDLLAEGEAAKN